MEFTAANGDTLCAEVMGEPPIFASDRSDRTWHLHVHWGTGRFSDVSGGAYFVGVITSDDSGTHIAVDFGGIIQY